MIFIRDSGTSIRFAGALGFALSIDSTSKSYRVIDKFSSQKKVNEPQKLRVYIFYLSGRLQLQLAVEPGPRSNFHLLRSRPHPRELEFSTVYQPHPNFDVHCETKIFALTPKF